MKFIFEIVVPAVIDFGAKKKACEDSIDGSESYGYSWIFLSSSGKMRFTKRHPFVSSVPPKMSHEFTKLMSHFYLVTYIR